jgi:hypothetical protein
MPRCTSNTFLPARGKVFLLPMVPDMNHHCFCNSMILSVSIHFVPMPVFRPIEAQNRAASPGSGA